MYMAKKKILPPLHYSICTPAISTQITIKPWSLKQGEKRGFSGGTCVTSIVELRIYQNSISFFN